MYKGIPDSWLLFVFWAMALGASFAMFGEAVLGFNYAETKCQIKQTLKDFPQPDLCQIYKK